jgi:hypothetical protein
MDLALEIYKYPGQGANIQGQSRFGNSSVDRTDTFTIQLKVSRVFGTGTTAARASWGALNQPVAGRFHD